MMHVRYFIAYFIIYRKFVSLFVLSNNKQYKNSVIRV
jgi:hypothetical protein